MANKDRNKRSARKARAQEREAREAAQAASQPSAAPKAKAEVAKSAAPKKSNGKPGFFKRIGNYFSDVRAEMHRVVWPSRPELKNYSLGVIAMLLVFGVAIWLVDLGIMGVLTVFAGLRG